MFYEHMLTFGCHYGQDSLTTPRDGLGSMRATHTPLPILRQCLHIARRPCFSQQSIFMPTHSGHHRVNVKKPKLLSEKAHFCGHPFLANNIFKQNRFSPRHTDRLIHAIWITFYIFFSLSLFKKLTNESQQHVCNVMNDLLWH